MGTIGSFFTTGKYWLIAMAIAVTVAFGAGFLKGSDHVVTKVVNASTAQLLDAQTKGEAAGRIAQKAYDDQQYAFSVADQKKRAKDDMDRNARLLALKQANQPKVTLDPNCIVLGEQMKALNDVVNHKALEVTVVPLPR